MREEGTADASLTATGEVAQAVSDMAIKMAYETLINLVNATGQDLSKVFIGYFSDSHRSPQIEFTHPSPSPLRPNHIPVNWRCKPAQEAPAPLAMANRPPRRA